MLHHYLTVALRTFRQQKVYTLIHVVGLALGLATCIVIVLVVRNELSYDAFHRKADRTYRVTLYGQEYNNPSVAFAVCPALRNDFPEFGAVSQYFYQPEGTVQVRTNRYLEKGYAFADGSFPSVFDFGWLAGNPATALTEPNTVVLTQRMARKYFGEQNALGKTIRLDNKWDLQVTGIIDDLPANTHLTFRFLVSFETIRKESNLSLFWAIQGGYLYVVLPEKRTADQIEARFPAFLQKNWGKPIARKATLLLQPLKEIHFDLRYLNQVSTPRSKATIYGLMGIALFILLTACINFINLSTAQAVKRSKEIGVRKTLGASRPELIGQVLGEVSCLVGLALVVALGLVLIFLPLMKQLLNIRVDIQQLGEPSVMAIVMGTTLGTILLAGLYPSFFQSGFQPINALASRSETLFNRKLTLFKGLVVVQFVISQILLIGTLIVARQMDYFLNQDLGFDPEAVVSFSVGNKPDVLRQQLQNNPGVQQVSFASSGPAYNTHFRAFSCPALGMTEVDVTEVKLIDEQYMPMYHLRLLAGNPIYKVTKPDKVVPIVVNQTLMKRLGIQLPKHAIGKQILIGGDAHLIIGVVEDFQSESKHRPIQACVLVYNPDAFWQASVKLRSDHKRETLTRIEQDWSALNPTDVFTYEFLDQHIAQLYTQEASLYTAFRLFCVIAIVIGCLGLYGLVSLMAVQRRKEVGIRKVLGASVMSIVGLFSYEFIWLILIAFVLASPVAWFAMHKWLDSFAYHIPIKPLVFLISMLITLLIATLTISYESIKAALMNPVKNLQTD